MRYGFGVTETGFQKKWYEYEKFIFKCTRLEDKRTLKTLLDYDASESESEGVCFNHLKVHTYKTLCV